MRRKMGFLFQNAALFDFLTLYDNLILPLRRLNRKSDQEIDEIIDRLLHQVGLGGDREKMRLELSGGMKKRAGLMSTDQVPNAAEEVGKRLFQAYERPIPLRFSRDSIQDDLFVYSRREGPTVRMPLSAIQGAFLSQEDKQVGGMPMAFGRAATPYGGGLVIGRHAVGSEP